MFVRFGRIRRTFYCLCTVVISYHVLTKGNEYYANGGWNSFRSSSISHRFIDANGRFISHKNHKILQFVEKTLSDRFADLCNSLEQQTELKEYFTFVPEHAYHITLTTLTEVTAHKQTFLELLIHEQNLMDDEKTFTLCTATQMLSIDQQEIRLVVQLPSDFVENTIHRFQKQWNNTFPKIIDEHKQSFYISLAYQYKPIPDKATFDLLEGLVQNWQDFPFEFYLEPIEICSYTDLTAYQPIVPIVPDL